jgi:hypothetical protein
MGIFRFCFFVREGEEEEVDDDDEAAAGVLFATS